MSKIRKYIDLALCFLFIISVVLVYYKYISHMSEYCFISGILVGITFFISFLWQQWQETPLPIYVYLACLVDIFVIFVATIAIGLNLEGAFWFIILFLLLFIGLYSVTREL